MPTEHTAEAAVEPEPRNEDLETRGATGASQGLLDRKEVLGGEFSLGWVGRGSVFSSGVGLTTAKATSGAAQPQE